MKSNNQKMFNNNNRIFNLNKIFLDNNNKNIWYFIYFYKFYKNALTYII